MRRFKSEQELSLSIKLQHKFIKSTAGFALLFALIQAEWLSLVFSGNIDSFLKCVLESREREWNTFYL